MGESASGLSISNVTKSSAILRWKTGCGASFRPTSDTGVWKAVPDLGDHVGHLEGLEPDTKYTVMVDGCPGFAKGAPASITFETEGELMGASASTVVLALGILGFAAMARKPKSR